MVKARWFKNPFAKLRSQRRAVLIDPSSGGEDIDRSKLIELLREHLGTEPAIYLSDQDYRLLDEDVFKKFASRDGTDAMPYESEGFDCDKFSRVFIGRISYANGLAGVNRGLAVGLVTGVFDLGGDKLTTMHMMIIVAFKGEKGPYIRLFEPQNDRLYEVKPKSVLVSVNM